MNKNSLVKVNNPNGWYPFVDSDVKCVYDEDAQALDMVSINYLINDDKLNAYLKNKSKDYCRVRIIDGFGAFITTILVRKEDIEEIEEIPEIEKLQDGSITIKFYISNIQYCFSAFHIEKIKKIITDL